MSNPRQFGALAAVAIALSTLGSAAYARECIGVDLPDEVTVDDHKLVLNGMGVRLATIFHVKVYVAGLYVETPSSDPKTVTSLDAVKRVVLVFVRSVSEDDMTKAIQEGFEKAAGEGVAKLQPSIDDFKKLLPTFKKGDRLTLTFRPGQGVEVVAPGRRGTVRGGDFARALLWIWLGPKPPNAALKEGMLGGSCG
jgi:hypothetical protein